MTSDQAKYYTRVEMPSCPQDWAYFSPGTASASYLQGNGDAKNSKLRGEERSRDVRSPVRAT